MNEKNLRENVAKLVDEILVQSDLAETINNVLNSERAKVKMDYQYGRIVEYINQIHEQISEQVPEELKEIEKKAFENILSKDNFVEKVTKSLKIAIASSVLMCTVGSTEETFLKEIVDLKKNEQYLLNFVDSVAEEIGEVMVQEYFKESAITDDMSEEEKAFVEFCSQLTGKMFNPCMMFPNI